MKWLVASLILLLSFAGVWLIVSPQKTVIVSPVSEEAPAQSKPEVRQKDLSLEALFKFHNEASQSAALPGEYTLIITGDVIPARMVNARMVAKNNFLYPWEKTAAFLRQADITVINLESPLFAGCPVMADTSMVFCGRPEFATASAWAGIDVATVANNHFGNFGKEKMATTEAILAESKIAVAGNGKNAVVTVRNKRFAFLAFNDVENTLDQDAMVAEIRQLRPKVDFEIVAIHWGTEYMSVPTKRQTELAHAAIDAGADLIAGNHPHWVQAVEEYRGKFIAYAHGNFIFDQMWSQETREGVVGRYIFSDKELLSVEYYPVIIDDFAQPRFTTQVEGEKILKRMKTASLEINPSL